jgi:hypothetical protein
MGYRHLPTPYPVSPFLSAFRVAVALAALLVAAPAALGAVKKAPDLEDRSNRERAARKACLTGDYTKGAEILADLFIDTKNPTYIFNQGRCFEQNRQYDEAISRFQEYLRASGTTDLDPGDRAAAERHIVDCKGALAEERDKAPATAPAPFAAPAPDPEPRASVATQAESPAATAGSGAGLRIGGIVVGSLGVAAVAAGVIFNLKANSTISDMKSVGGYSPSRDTDRKTYQTVAWVGYGAGAACILTGALLYTVGFKQAGNASHDLALLPAISDSHAGVALTGGF